MKKISIVTPCYNEEDNIEVCYLTLKKIMSKSLAMYEYEHIFCDNASTDKTLNILKTIAKKDKNVKIIVNSRNFGPMRSNFNGIIQTSGDAVITFLPADLQDPPELIVDFVKKWEEGYHVVYGVRDKREESLFMLLIRKLYYRIVNKTSNISIPIDAGDFQLVDKKVIKNLKEFDDYYPYIRGMIAFCGFKSFGVKYTWKKRERGFSKNSFLSLIDQGLNGIISFTNTPLRMCMFFGFIIAAGSVFFASWNLVMNIVHYRKLASPGIPMLITALFFFSGIQLFFLGIMGEYLGAIHAQTRKKPVVIELEKVNF